MPLIAVGVGFHGGSALDPRAGRGCRGSSPPPSTRGPAISNRASSSSASTTSRSISSSMPGSTTSPAPCARSPTSRDQAFDLLRLALTVPRFDAEPVERIRGQLLAILDDDFSEPGSIADRVWWHTAFPDHPYGRADRRHDSRAEGDHRRRPARLREEPLRARQPHRRRGRRHHRRRPASRCSTAPSAPCRRRPALSRSARASRRRPAPSSSSTARCRRASCCSAPTASSERIPISTPPT